MDQIVFWQGIVSPHMIGLAEALAKGGCEVSYIAEQKISAHRAKSGWKASKSEDVEIILLDESQHVDRLIGDIPTSAIHLVQGVRGNSSMAHIRKQLRKNRRQWGATMETVDERSWIWPLKRIAYRASLANWNSNPDFVLAIGNATPNWVAARGYPAEKTFPFSYFLSGQSQSVEPTGRNDTKLSIGYVGQLISRKRVDLLIEALAGLDVHLTIVGDGPLFDDLHSLAVEKLGKNRFAMLGTLPMPQIRSVMNGFDCLVLPSDHDGWGAVVSEALMAGVPAICSDACGAAAVVRASGVGGVFCKGDVAALRAQLKDVIEDGAFEKGKRQEVSNWAQCLAADAGAGYLLQILDCVYTDGARPVSPWDQAK